MFRTGQTNLLPFGVAYDRETNVSTLYDRLYRPIISCHGKWPRCDLALATVCNDPPLYGVEPIATFFRADAQPVCDPAVRKRLRSLIDTCAVLKSELRRRALIASDAPPPTQAQQHADLISQTFATA
jgi:hypothetical protein